MNIYEQGVANLQNANPETIKEWIARRGIEITPLDSSESNRSVSIVTLLLTLFQLSDLNNQKKIKNALELLLPELLEQGELQDMQYILYCMSKIGCEFPLTTLLEFVSLYGTDTESKRPEQDILMVLEEHIKGSKVIQEKFWEWFWQDPISIGDTHALTLFTGLVDVLPREFPKLLVRLMEINKRSPSELVVPY